MFFENVVESLEVLLVGLVAALLGASLRVHKVASGSLLSIRVHSTVTWGIVHGLVHLLAITVSAVLGEQRVALLEQHFVDTIDLPLGCIVARQLIAAVTTCSVEAATAIKAEALVGAVGHDVPERLDGPAAVDPTLGDPAAFGPAAETL